MKIVVDEKVKHRFVGITVILSIGIVFAPAILKKSQRRLEDTVSLSVKLPPKPILPQVSVRDSKALFETVKVAHVDIPSVEKSSFPTPALAKAQSLSSHPRLLSSNVTVQNDNKRESLHQADKKLGSLSQLVQTAELEIGKPVRANDSNLSQLPSIKPVHVQLPTSQPALAKKLPTVQLPPVARNSYGVQLAMFAVHGNAVALVNKLKNKGYHAQYNKVIGKNGGVYYKVVVGYAKERTQALRLQKQLVEAVKINGFIIKGMA
jgi:DedD protein